jgi:hypothetical protein
MCNAAVALPVPDFLSAKTRKRPQVLSPTAAFPVLGDPYAISQPVQALRPVPVRWCGWDAAAGLIPGFFGGFQFFL